MLGASTTTAGTGNATTTPLTFPVGTAAGDVAVLKVTQQGTQLINSNSISATQRARRSLSTNTLTVTIFTKVLTSTDVSSNSVTVTFAAGQIHVVELLTVTGGSDFDAISTFSETTSNVTSLTVPAVTPIVNGALMIGSVSGRVGVTTTDTALSWPAGLTEQTERMSTGANLRIFGGTGSALIVGGAGVAQGPDTVTSTQASQYIAYRLSIAPLIATLSGDGSLTATAGVAAAADLTSAGMAAVSASAVLATTAAVSQPATVSLTGTAALSATAVVSKSIAAALTATAALAAVATVAEAAVTRPTTGLALAPDTGRVIRPNTGAVLH